MKADTRAVSMAELMAAYWVEKMDAKWVVLMGCMKADSKVALMAAELVG